MSESTLIALKEFLGFLIKDIGDALVKASAKQRMKYYCGCDEDTTDDDDTNDETNEGENV